MALRANDESTLLQMVKAFEGAPSAWDILVWTPGCEHDVLVTDRSEGDGILFDPGSPEAAVAGVRQRLSAPGSSVTAVTGARRGTGVTTLALHLASALAEAHDVCLVDLDPSSSLRARLGLPVDARDWGSVEERVLEAALPVAGGFRLLLAPLDRRGADVAGILSAVVARFAHVVVDAPSSPWAPPALAAASDVLLVVPPSRQGVAAAELVMDGRPEAPWSCVVNRVGAGGELTAAAIASALGRPVSVELPCSPFLRDREDDHRLLVEKWSRYYRRVSRLAGAL